MRPSRKPACAAIQIVSPADNAEVRGHKLIAEYVLKALSRPDHHTVQVPLSPCTQMRSECRSRWCAGVQSDQSRAACQVYVDGEPAGAHQPLMCDCATDGTCSSAFDCKQTLRTPDLPSGLCRC